MNTSDTQFRKKSTLVETKTKEEAPVLPKISTDIVSKTTSSSSPIESKFNRIKRISNLFSMALNECKNLREQSMSQREQGIRFEELIDTLRLQCLKTLETENEI